MLMFILHLSIITIGIVLLACSLIGIGIGFSRIAKIDFPESEKPFISFWIGFSLAILLFQILQLFIPITIFPSAVVFGAGIILFIRFQFKNVSNLFRNRINVLYFSILGLLIIFVAYLSLFPPYLWDGDLYHFSVIRWLNEYPIILGLGNLHGRLAFNQSFFLFVAAVNLYPLFNYGYYLSNGLLILVLIAEILYVMFSIINTKKKHSLSFIKSFPILFTFPIIYMLVYSNWSSPSPDIASTSLQLVLFIYFVREIAENKFSKYSNSRFTVNLLLAAILITIKLSNWAFAGSIIAILLIRKTILFWKEPKKIIASFSKPIIVPAFVMISWCVRSFFLSGCIAYPTSVGCFDVSWAIPKEKIELMTNLILAWGRWQNQPYQKVLGSWNWLTPWFETIKLFYSYDIIYPFFVSLLLIALSVTVLVRKSNNDWKFQNHKFFWLPIPPILALTAWFFTAPDPRFLNGLFWILPISLLIQLFYIFEEKYKLKFTKFWFILFTAFLSINVCLNFIQYPSDVERGYLPTFTYLTQYDLEQKTTDSDLHIWVPVDGDQCGSKELLCTPDFDKKLKLIGSDIKSGFMIVEK